MRSGFVLKFTIGFHVLIPSFLIRGLREEFYGSLLLYVAVDMQRRDKVERYAAKCLLNFLFERLYGLLKLARKKEKKKFTRM